MTKWQEVKLGDVCDLIAGFAFKSKNFGDYPDKVIKITNIEPPFVNMESLSGVDLSEYNKSKLTKFIAQKGDYVLAMTGATIGKLGRICKGNAYINQRVLMFKPTQTDKKFLYYVLADYNFNQYVLNHIDSESAQANISATTIGKYEFSLPPLDIQKKIAGVLGALDDKIELNNKINNNLEQQAQALFKSWFVDKEYEVERETTLGVVCKCELGGTPSRIKSEYWGGNIAWINSGEVNNFRITKASEYITEIGLKHSATKLLPRKTTVLAITGATLGQISLLEIDSCTNQSVVGVLENETLPYEFIYPYICYNIKELLSHQTGGAQQHINKQNVEQLTLSLPKSTLIKDYKNIVAPIFELIAKNCFESERLAAIRDALLPKLMSGEIDVSNVDISADKLSFSEE